MHVCGKVARTVWIASRATEMCCGVRLTPHFRRGSYEGVRTLTTSNTPILRPNPSYDYSYHCALSASGTTSVAWDAIHTARATLPHSPYRHTSRTRAAITACQGVAKSVLSARRSRGYTRRWRARSRGSCSSLSHRLSARCQPSSVGSQAAMPRPAVLLVRCGDCTLSSLPVRNRLWAIASQR
eukprot:2270536-Rhodomonas_salina.1